MNIRGAIFHSFYYLTHKNGSSYFSVERVYIHSLTPSVWTWEKRTRFQINTKIGFGHPTTWKKNFSLNWWWRTCLLCKRRRARTPWVDWRALSPALAIFAVYTLCANIYLVKRMKNKFHPTKRKKKLCERLELFFMASSDIFSFLSIIRKKGINSEREKEKGKREDKKKKRGSLPF